MILVWLDFFGYDWSICFNILQHTQLNFFSFGWCPFCRNVSASQHLQSPSSLQLFMLEPQPATTVVFKTPKGALELQLWTKEIGCARKFVEKCTTGFSGGLTFSKAVHDNVIEAQASTIEYDMDLESHPRINFSQRGYVGALKDEKTGKFSADGIFITLKEIPTFHKKYTVIGKVTTDTFFTVLKITEGENEDGKLIYPVSATPISIDGDEAKIQVVEPSLVQSEKSQQNAKKTKRRVALDYDEQPDIEVKRVKMKLAHELLGEKKEEESEEKKEEKVEEKVGEKVEEKVEEKVGEKVEEKKEEKSDEKSAEKKEEKIEKIQNEDKNAKVNENNDDKEKNKNDKAKEEKYDDEKANIINNAEPPKPSQLSKNKDLLSQKEITSLQEPKNRDQYKQVSRTSRRRRSFVYNPALDFDSSDEAPPTNLKTHVYK